MMHPGLTTVLFLTLVAAGLPHVGSAQTPGPECAQLANLRDDGAPLAAGLVAPDASATEPSQVEAACRLLLKTDPANPSFMFLLGRALSLGHKRLEAIRYYLDAADRGHAGAMNDLGGLFEYGIGIPKNMTTALIWYEKARTDSHAQPRCDA
jgi:TPR repeat protein